MVQKLSFTLVFLFWKGDFQAFGTEVIFNFQIINNDLLKWTVNYDGKGSESGNLIKVNKSFSKKNCTSGPSKTGLFG